MNGDALKKLRREKGMLLLDGATGTMLGSRGMPGGVIPEAWILEHPEVLAEIQKEYIASGSSIVYAPTFGGNRIKLAAAGLAEEHDRMNRELAGISLKAAEGRALVFGDISSTGELIEPYGDLAAEDAEKAFRDQAKALLAAGVDGIVIETMMDLNEAELAVRSVREVAPDLALALTLTFAGNGRTIFGNSAEDLWSLASKYDLTAAGCNCSSGPAAMADILRGAPPREGDFILVAKPNAGMPQFVDGKTVFDLGPGAFADECAAFAELGVGLAGGCCGSTPEHISGLRRVFGL